MNRRVLLLAFVVAAPSAALVFAACNGQSDACAITQTSCNGVCVTTGNDPANCGGCGKTCQGTELCSHGACVSVCASNEQACPVEAGGGFCTDLQNDNANCGACGAPCQPLERCTAGQCGAGCTSGQTGCVPEGGGAPFCVSTKSDGYNCGGCNVRCKTLEYCSAGACVSACAQGQMACASDAGDGGGPGYCANTQTDNLNCGGCGTACGTLQACVGGTCAKACTGNQTACLPDGGDPDAAPFCTDTASDNANCGSCFSPCPYAKPLCVSGACYSLDATPG